MEEIFPQNSKFPPLFSCPFPFQYYFAMWSNLFCFVFWLCFLLVYTETIHQCSINEQIYWLTMWYDSVLPLLCRSVSQSCPTLCDPIDCSTPGFPVLHCLLEFAQTDPLDPWCHPTICHPLLLPPSIFPNMRVSSNESSLFIRCPKYWNLSFRSPSNEYSRLTSFRIHWLDVLAVQETLKSLLQHHSLKASVP